MASRAIGSGADHDARVRAAELDASLADIVKGDFRTFQSALASSEEFVQDFWRILNLDPAIKESVDALFMEQRKQCEVTSQMLDSLVGRYDRYLNLVLYFHSHSHGQWVIN